MASNATIGALRVVLGADTAAFDSGLKGAEKTMAAFQANMTKIGVALGAGIVTAATAFGLALKNAIDQADKMGKMAQQFGIPVEELSKLKLAADLSGVSIEEVGKAVGRLSRSMSEIAGGKNEGGAAAAFKALGISATDAGGKLKSSQDIMGDVADRFAAMQDGAGKTALAISIFGRSGAALIPLLNQGRDGLKQAAEEAEKLGLVIDGKTARAAEAFNDNLTRIGKVTEGVALKIAAELAPALKLATDRYVEWIKANDEVGVKAGIVMTVIDGIGRTISATTIFFKQLGAEGAAFAEVFAAIGEDINRLVAPAFNSLNSAIDRTGQALIPIIERFARASIAVGEFIAQAAKTETARSVFSNLNTTIEKFGQSTSQTSEEVAKAEPTFARTTAAWQKYNEVGMQSWSMLDASRTAFQDFREQADMLARHMENVASATKKTQAPVLASKSALDEFFKSQQKNIASMQADMMTVGMAAGARERLRFVLQAETIARENNIIMTEAQRVKMTELAIMMEQATLQQQGYNLLLESAAPHEKFRLELANNMAALQAVGATAQQMGQVQQMVAEKYGQTWQQMASGVAGNFAALFNELGKKNESFAVAAKALAIVEATINTYVAFTKALASAPPPWNYALAAGTLAAGMAKVIAISSQQVPKMASGGIMIPKQFNGPDSVLMQARVRPDEEVHVVRPGDADPRGRGRAGSFTTVMMQLPSGAAGRFIEELISDINGKVADGYRLVTSPV